ncbi:MAG: DUF6602 domain-containing protein [Egibacteraceae bacterium]
MTDSVRESFWALERSLLANAQESGLFSGSTTIGNAREFFIREAAPRIGLPGRVTVAAGEIVSGVGTTTGQVDAIFIDSKFGVRRIGDQIHAGPEAVIAAAEVKSSLAGDELKVALKKAAAIKKQVRPGGTGMMRGGQGNERVPVPPVAPYAFIVAIRAPAWATVFKNICENADWWNHDFMAYGPDLIWVLNEGVAVKNDRMYMTTTRDEAVMYDQTCPGSQAVMEYITGHIQRYGDLTY